VRARAGRAAWRCWAERVRARAQEQAGLAGTDGLRTRVSANARGWAACVAGLSKGEVRESARAADFYFSFSKNVYSNKFCLFCFGLFKIPKMVKIIV
jgi:hypothetical protein